MGLIDARDVISRAKARGGIGAKITLSHRYWDRL